MEREKKQPLPSLEERMEMETVAGRLDEIRGSITHLEEQLIQAKGAADATPEGDKREELLETIGGLQEALEHLREEEAELVAHNTEAEPDEAAA